MKNEINIGNIRNKLFNLNPYIPSGVYTWFKETTSDSQHYHRAVVTATSCHSPILHNLCIVTHPAYYYKKCYEDDYIKLANGNMGVDPNVEVTIRETATAQSHLFIVQWSGGTAVEILRDARRQEKKIDQIISERAYSIWSTKRYVWLMNHGLSTTNTYIGYDPDIIKYLVNNFGASAIYVTEPNIDATREPIQQQQPEPYPYEVMVVTIDEDGNRQEQQTQFTAVEENDDEWDPDEIVDQAEGGIIEEVIETNDDQIEVIDITIPTTTGTPNHGVLRIRID